MTIIGNLASDPEIRFTPSGKAVASFTILTSKSKKDEATGKWESTDTTGWLIKAWDQLGENVGESLQKGDAVIVNGTAVYKSWEKEDGSKGGRIEVTAWNVGLDLKRRSAKVNRTDRPAVAVAVNDDPWASNPVEEPPF
jgi:single-strand DNA-binding protein